MVGTYCSPEDVSGYLQRADFKSDSIPSRDLVDAWIEEMESEIEERTKTSWKPKSITEYHQFEFRPRVTHRRWTPRVILNRIPVLQFDPDEGDVLEVWNGASWENWLITKQEGRDKDFWIEYENGLIHFNIGYVIRRWHENGVRVRYRTGHENVDGWVKHLATLMTARKVAEFDKKRLLVQGGEGNPEKVPLSNQISQITEEITAIFETKRLMYKNTRPWTISG